MCLAVLVAVAPPAAGQARTATGSVAVSVTVIETCLARPIPAADPLSGVTDAVWTACRVGSMAQPAAPSAPGKRVAR